MTLVFEIIAATPDELLTRLENMWDDIPTIALDELRRSLEEAGEAWDEPLAAVEAQITYRHLLRQQGKSIGDKIDLIGP